MEAILRNRFRLLVFLPIAFVLILVNGVAPSEAAVNGTVRQVGNQQILNLWGTNYEMGYAHGYLMADKIRDLVDHYMIGTLAGGNVAVYNDLLARDASPEGFLWQQQYLDEINGMSDGMTASGKNLYVPRLGRNIDSRDIRAFNLQDQFWFSCSSFGVWGNATSGGETILARNFDFYYDNQGNIANYQIIIAYEPTGKAKFISFAWPGMVGVYSGMNESGVSALVNTGNGDNPYSGPFHPIVEVFRSVLENTTPANYLTEPLFIVDSFYELTPEILQIGIPYQGSGDPVYYIEESPDWNAIRYPADTDPGYDHIIATNHFIKALPPPSSGDSVTRYNMIRNGLINLYGTGDRKVDSAEARGLLRSVADVVAPTLNSMIIRPNRMEFDLSFAKLENGTFTSAKDMQPQTYTWTSLFPSHEPVPDLIVQSIVADPAHPEVGQPVAVTVTVKNQGSVYAGGYSIDFYQNLTSPPASHQAGDANCDKNGLAAGATDSCTFTATFSAAGSYEMWAQADTEQQVVESDETNNVFGPQTITAGPAAVNDAYSTAQNTILNQAAPGVLGNDNAPEGAALTAQLATGPSHGTLALNANGSFAYTPVTDYVGSDSFTYTANDGTTSSNIATVTITIASSSGVLFSDDFARAQLAPWVNVRGTWSITNDVLRGSSSPSTYASIHTETTPLWTDYSVEGQIQFPAGAFGGGIGGRVNPATGTRYGAWVYPAGSLGGSNVLKLVKFRDWTTWNGTPMKQVSLPDVGTGWHTLKMVFKGSQLQVSYDGTLMIDVTDNNFDSRAPYLSGGISADLWTYTTSYVMAVDNVIVRTLAAPTPVLSSLSLNPTSVVGGNPSQGTVTLSGPAPSGGAVVSLSDNSSAASEPATVTVPGGSTSATFTITTSPVTRSRSVTISAAAGGVTKTAVLTVNP
jgi:hypothetical protein